MYSHNKAELYDGQLSLQYRVLLCGKLGTRSRFSDSTTFVCFFFCPSSCPSLRPLHTSSSGTADIFVVLRGLPPVSRCWPTTAFTSLQGTSTEVEHRGVGGIFFENLEHLGGGEQVKVVYDIVHVCGLIWFRQRKWYFAVYHVAVYILRLMTVHHKSSSSRVGRLLAQPGQWVIGAGKQRLCK